jgi:hypothetical protein
MDIGRYPRAEKDGVKLGWSYSALVGTVLRAAGG